MSDVLVNFTVELVESVVCTLDLGGDGIIDSLPSEWPVVAGKNLDVEIHYASQLQRTRLGNIANHHCDVLATSPSP
jgi:hypothetical protein